MSLGVDLMAVDELDRLVGRRWFDRYCFAPGELAEAAGLSGDRRREFLAGRFAAKEAVLKVLGLGLFQGIQPCEIAVDRLDTGAPQVRLCGAAWAAAGRAGIVGVAVSITHKRDLLCALAVGWRQSEGGSL